MPYIIGTRSPQTLELSAGAVRSAITTTTSTEQSVLVSLSTDTFRSVNYQIQAVQGQNYNTTEIRVIHNGSDAFMTEFATINQPSGISTYSTDCSEGNLRLLAFPASSEPTTFKIIYAAFNT
jgi:hypothetical protein